MGIGGAAIIGALELTLEASVGQAPLRAAAFGQGGAPSAGSAEVVLGAPVDVRLLALALAMLGGLVAGAAGGLRAARLRPAQALRSVE